MEIKTEGDNLKIEDTEELYALVHDFCEARGFNISNMICFLERKNDNSHNQYIQYFYETKLRKYIENNGCTL